MKRYEVILQPFSEKLGDFWIEFLCPHCKETVKATKKTQNELAVGGVGHKCNNCGTYFAFFRCPCCNNIAGFDDKEWELLASPEGEECPNCKASLYRNKENWRPTLMSIASYSPDLSLWSASEIEQAYISRLRLNCKPERQKMIAIRHHSVGVRMKSSKQSMDFLLNEKWYSPLGISNTPSYHTEKKLRTPFDHEFHNHVFGFINNLRSALDMLAQEVVSIYLSNYKEKEIEYNSFSKKLPMNINYIDSIVNSFKTGMTFSYLNKLRNVLQHRRLPMMVTIGEFETVQLDSIRPINVNSLATVHLPNNPDDEPDDIPDINGLEIFSFIKRTYSDTESHMLEVYEKIKP